MAKRNRPTEPKKAPQQQDTTTATPAISSASWWVLGAMLLLFIITRLVYQSALDNQFVEWDDQLYVTENPMVLQHGQPGTPPVWKTPIALNYHPLTMESLIASADGAQIKPGQLSPRPFIETNILWHCANSALVLLFVWLLTRGNWPVSVFSGLIFALHPMHVESVAWISERKDVLYAFFFLAAAIAYIRYTDTRKWLWLAGALVLFVLSCLSKAMAVSLVPVLLLIDWWRDRSLRSAGIWLEKIPFIAVAAFFGLIALDIQSGGNFHGMLSGIEGVKTATTSADKIFLTERIQCAAYGMVQYGIRFFAPMNLSPFYPYPNESVSHTALPAAYPLSILALLIVAGLAIWSRRYTKAVLFGLGFYLFTVLLVSQVIAVGVVVMADRYTYLPYIGLALSVLLLIDQWAAKNKSLGYAAWALVGVATLFWTMQTPKQIEVWQNSETLWTTAERFYPGDGQILANLGNYYGKSGNLDKAQSCFERAIKSNIRNAAVYEGLGNVYGSKNDHRKAAEMFAEAINIDPRKGNYYFNRGTAYSNFDPAKGIEDLNKALSLMPPAKKNDVLSRRGFCYFQLKDYPKAIADYSTVIASGGAGASVYFDRGVAKLNMNDTPAAIADFEGALRVDPNFALAKNALGQLRK